MTPTVDGSPPAPGRRWLVLGRRTPTDVLAEVGEVHAPDAEMAALLARDAFFRHGEGVGYAVVPLDEVHTWRDPESLIFHTDKSYKLQSGYTGLGAKRRRARERVAAMGATIMKDRPEDKRRAAEDETERQS